MHNMVMTCDVKMSQTSPNEAFELGVSCGRKELLLIWSLIFLTLKTFYMQNNINDTWKERKGTLKQKKVVCTSYCLI